MKTQMKLSVAVICAISLAQAVSVFRPGSAEAQQTPAPPGIAVTQKTELTSVDAAKLAGGGLEGGANEYDLKTVWKKDMEDVNIVSEEKQTFCVYHIINVVNKSFGADFTTKDVRSFKIRHTKEDDLGFLRGGGLNIRLESNQVKESVAARIKAGRDPQGHTRLKGGVGATLHIEDNFDGFNDTIVNQPNNDGTGNYTVKFYAHIDSAFAYEVPVGPMWHLFVDVIGKNSRNPCPGKDPAAQEEADKELAFLKAK